MNNNTEVTFCPSLPADHILSSGVVIYPGVFDQLGSPLVIFPAESQDKLVSHVTKEEVAQFIFYSLRLHNKSRSECLVSVVADLREASVGVTRCIVELLLLLELHKRSVHSFYVVQPKKRDAQKSLHKLSSKRSSPTRFKCVFLKDVFELCKYVDRSQLPTHLGGYFIYSHENWVTLVKEMDSFAQDFVGVVRKLPECIGALQDFSKLLVPANYEALAHFCSSNQVRLQQLRSELGLDVLLRNCENMLEKLRHPETDPCYWAMAGTVLFNHTAMEMLHNYERIRSAVEKVELLWRRTFSSAHLQLNILQQQRDAQQVVCEMEVMLEKLQSYTPEVLRDGSRIETLRHEFNTSVRPHALMLRRRAEAVLQADSKAAALPQRRDWIQDLENRMERLRSAVEFQNRNVNNIWTFHQCYRRIQNWFDMAVSERFLQDLLWSSCCNELDTSLSHHHDDVLVAIEAFLTVHRPPHPEQLTQLAQLSNVVSDSHLESAGKRLAHRCTSLQRLLTSPGSASFRDLQLVLGWQYEHLKSKNSSLLEQNVVASDIMRSSSRRVNRNNLTNRDDIKTNPPLLPPEKPPSSSSFDSGFDGAATGNLETGQEKQDGHGCRTLKSRHLRGAGENAASVSKFRVAGEPTASIRVVSNVDSVNLEITVKRSTALPKNPWLSLPVADLDNCYTVIISPSSHAQRGATLSCERLTQTDRCVVDPNLSVSEDQDLEWSPIRNVLSSTITDVGGGAEQTETTPTLLWDSYDLHDLNASAGGVLDDVDRCEWDLNEEQELRSVEETLSRAAGILHEEENVLAQEEILDALLNLNHPDRLWPLWNNVSQLSQMSYSDLSDAGVIGLEDLASLDFTGKHDSPSQQYPVIARTCAQSPALLISEPQSSSEHRIHVEPGTAGSDRTEILKELNDLQALEDQIEEKLKLNKPCSCKSEEKSSSSSSSSSFQGVKEDRTKFLAELEREKKEVEEMERNLRLESRNSKVVTISIMGNSSALRGFEDDEALVRNCKRSTPSMLEERSNQEAPPFIPDESFYSERSHSEALEILESSNNATNDDRSIQIMDCRGSTSSEVNSTMEDFLDQNSLEIQGSKTHCSASEVGDLSAVEELTKPLDLEIKPDARDLRDGTSECLDTGDGQTAVPTSREASEPAFDPGGPKLIPKLFTGSAEETASQDLPDVSVNSSATSPDPKLKVRKKASPSKSNVLQHQNNNNNNFNSGTDRSELNQSGSAGRIYFTKQTSRTSPEAEDQRLEHTSADVSRTPSPQCPTSNNKSQENKKDEQNPEPKRGPEVPSLQYDDWAMRSAYRSLVHHELQIFTREMNDFQTPLVFDTGSGLVKAGFADQDLPTTIFPTAIGIPKYEEVMSSSFDRSVYVGHDAQHMRGVLALQWPMKNGVVRNWVQMEMIWQHAFDQLRVCSEEHPVLLTAGVTSVKENQQRSVQIMFESFNVPLTYTALQPVLALYTTGRTTGVVFDSGDGVSHSVPVYDGYSLPHAVQRFNLAGSDVTLRLQQLLREQGVCMRTSAEMEIVRDVKERCCVVALDYDVDLKGGGGASSQVQYTLPDGRIISLTHERFRAPEILFKPELIGQDFYGVHECVFKSVLQTDIDLRKDLVGNIVLSGGNTLLPGLPERLRCEISRLGPAGLGPRVNVVSPKDRDFSVWRGGAVLASMPAFSSTWISREEYEEFGPQIVLRKCF